jgi:hypothetical protein
MQHSRSLIVLAVGALLAQAVVAQAQTSTAPITFLVMAEQDLAHSPPGNKSLVNGETCRPYSGKGSLVTIYKDHIFIQPKSPGATASYELRFLSAPDGVHDVQLETKTVYGAAPLGVRVTGSVSADGKLSLIAVGEHDGCAYSSVIR